MTHSCRSLLLVNFNLDLPQLYCFAQSGKKKKNNSLIPPFFFFFFVSDEATVERKNQTHSFKKDSASSLLSKRLTATVESLSHTLYYSALGEAAAAAAAPRLQWDPV